MKKIVGLLVFLLMVAALAFSGPKTEFQDGTPALGIKGTKVTAEHLNKSSYSVPTGEDQEGSTPPLYSADTGTVNAYVVDLVQGKQRVVSTNTGTATNKLIDSLATFQTDSVAVGDVVLNIASHTSTTVTAIDSETQLSITDDIFTAPSVSYAVGPNIQQLPQAYVAGQTIAFRAANTNTGASTINVNSLGAKTIKKDGSQDLIAGEITAGQIVALTYDGTYMQMISPPRLVLISDIFSFTTSSLPSSETWSGIGYGDGRFVAVNGSAGTAAAYSSDGGETWTASTLPSSAVWYGPAFGDGRFVSVSATGTAAAYSSDGGETWTASTLPSSQAWASVAYGNGRFVAVSISASTAAAYSSDGGETWTASTLPSSQNWYGVSYGNGRFVAVGGTGTAAAYSTDGGETWTASTLPSSQAWAGVAYGNGNFVAVNRDSATAAAYSSDGGETWTASTLPSSQIWYKVAYGNGRFIAVSGNTSTAAAYSTDGGKTWTAGILPASGSWRSIAYGLNRFVAVSGSSGAVAAYATTTLSLP